MQETLVIPLYGRKLCTEQFPNLFRDEKAVRLIDRIDYDFSVLEKRSKSFAHRFGALEVAMRENDLMIEAKEYLKDHPYHRIPVRRYGACGDLYAVLNGGEYNESLYAGGARRDGTAVKYGVFKNSRQTIRNTNLKRRV